MTMLRRRILCALNWLVEMTKRAKALEMSGSLTASITNYIRLMQLIDLLPYVWQLISFSTFSQLARVLGRIAAV